jgi:hypothetical protein
MCRITDRMDDASYGLIGLWLRDPNWATLLILGTGYTAVALILHWLSFGRPFMRLAEGYRGVVPPYLTSPAMVFALMTAFLSSAVVGTNRDTERAVQHERDGAAVIIQFADIVPAAHDLHRLTETYIRAVLDREWRRPRDFAPCDAALQALTEEAVLALPTQAAVPPMVPAQLLREVREIGSARSIRRGIVESQVDEIPWLSVLLLGVLTQIGIAVVQLDKPKPQALALAVTTASIVVVLGLIALMERPFDGLHIVSPAPLQRVLSAGQGR